LRTMFCKGKLKLLTGATAVLGFDRVSHQPP